MAMCSSLKTFMDGIIDYAGLFPPAKLPLKEAAEKYSDYRSNHEQAFFLSRFICPAKGLAGFSDLPPLLDQGKPWHFSVLAGTGDSAAEHAAALTEGYQLVSNFIDQNPGRVFADALETKIPQALFSQAKTTDLCDFFLSASECLEEVAPGPVEPWFEIHFSDNWQAGLAAAAEAMAAHNKTWESGKVAKASLKIRTGGVEAHMFPSCEQVAATLIAARDHNLCFKATAGLHHPVRHHNDTVQTKMHGFFNVFGGAILARVYGLDEAALLEILNDEEAGSFGFSGDTMSWRNLSATTEQIGSAREAFCRSYGSCSFLEPVEDLTDLGLIT